jgi:restriction system protein
MGGELHDFNVEHRRSLAGPDGEFEIDAVARFEALGIEFLVLVECKHCKNRVKRETVQLLRDKLRSLAAHKGMVFSTGGFQKGAIEYATAQRIALIHYTEGGPIYEMKAQDGPAGPCREYDAYVVSAGEKGGPIYHYGAYGELVQYLFGEQDSGQPGVAAGGQKRPAAERQNR